MTQEQSAIVIGLFDIVAVLMIFITGAHLLPDHGGGGQLQPPAAPAPPLFTGDMLSMTSRLVNQAFYMGIRLAAPFLVFEMVFQVDLRRAGAGCRRSSTCSSWSCRRKIALGLSILMITLPTLMLVFLRFFDDSLHTLVGPLTGLR